jgi:1-deoxy-D-xylulose-5-phosphate reductoisomerase
MANGPVGIAVLGSTGTIGRNTLALVDRFPERFRVATLSARGSDPEAVATQIERYRPKLVALELESAVEGLQNRFPSVTFVAGPEGNEAASTHDDVATVVVGIVGFAALRPVVAAIRAGKRLALANKETLVAAGALVRGELERHHKAELIPVDSEHSALFQVLDGRDRAQIATLVLTASGGPFLRRPELDLSTVTPEMAVAHPNWRMGPKISVDSATMMNKGLELVEACFLYDVPESKVEIWVHPQSIVHGAVWFRDQSCLAQLSVPDMRQAIAFALSYPERLDSPIAKLGLAAMRQLEFFPPDETRFPALRLARDAMVAGATARVALNASNEVAVERFLAGALRFDHIPVVVEETLERIASVVGSETPSLAAVFDADRAARRLAGEASARRACR